MKFFSLFMFITILFAIVFFSISSVEAEDSKYGLFSLYEATSDGDAGFYIQKAWKNNLMIAGFWGNNNWAELYLLGRKNSLPLDIDLYIFYVSVVQRYPLVWKDHMPQIIVQGKRFFLFNNIKFPLEPYIGWKNPDNHDHIRYAIFLYVQKGFKIGPLVDGEVFFNRESRLFGGIMASYDQEISWGKWGATLYLTSCFLDDKETSLGESRLRFQFWTEVF